MAARLLAPSALSPWRALVVWGATVASYSRWMAEVPARRDLIRKLIWGSTNSSHPSWLRFEQAGDMEMLKAEYYSCFQEDPSSAIIELVIGNNLETVG